MAYSYEQNFVSDDGLELNQTFASAFENYNKVNASDLEQLKNVASFKIKVKKEIGKHKVGDILEVKSIRNTFQSEPPSFIVIDEKLGAEKYGYGGRGWNNSLSWFENYDVKGQPMSVTEQTLTTDSSGETFLQKNKTNLLIIGALVLGYFAYKKFNK
jgi:hypothetical protein